MQKIDGRDAPTGRSHGGFSTAELEVPWILSGPGVVAGRLTVPISSTDAAPTLLHALGVTPPEQMHGRVVAEAFGGGGGRWRVASRPLRNESLAAALLPPASEARHSALGSSLGWLLLALCAVLTLPQVVRAIKRSRGVSTGFAPGYVRAGGVMMSPMPLTSP